MKAEKHRIERLRRLERLRAIAKQQAAAESAQAEGVLAQLRMLTERTRGLAQEYAARGDAMDGFELIQSARFAAGLCKIVNSTEAEVESAQHHADGKAAALVSAERRRAAVEQRVETERRAIAKRGEIAASGARRKFGTDLE